MERGPSSAYPVFSRGISNLIDSFLFGGLGVAVRMSHLQHGLEVLSHLEGSLGLGLDLVDGDAVGDLNQGQAVSEVDVKDTLSSQVSQE